jgi:UDP-N-acetylmuramyl pentapeptide phosphotransferase/UDP-N-acetylglucosamine-1-phosphate transferase
VSVAAAALRVRYSAPLPTYSWQQAPGAWPQVVPRAYAALGLADASAFPPAHADPWSDDFPAAIASITLMLTLGFVDDVLDLPWRAKLAMPLVATLPLLAAYSGATAVGVPKPLVAALDLSFTYVELGPLYYVYMAALVVFCSNSINILAGVNGLEAGQSLLVGGAILAHNVLQLSRSDRALPVAPHERCAGAST